MQTTNFLIFQFILSLDFYKSQLRAQKNKACRYLENWVCLLSCVNILRIFLENLDYSVPDAEFKFVFFNQFARQNWVFLITISMEEITLGITE